MRALLRPALIGVLIGACAPAQPPRWAEGGARVALGAARWDRGDAEPIELRPDGRVLIDGDLAFVIDPVGRVTNGDYEPYAVLLPDGQLVGPEGISYGRLGVTNASPPGAIEAWLAVTPDGTVTYFDSDGARNPGGVWQGCTGPVLRTCTLVTQLVAVWSYRRGRVGFGMGVGVGVGVGF